MFIAALPIVLALLILFFQQGVADIRAAHKLAPTSSWFGLPVVRGFLAFIALLVVPALFVEHSGLGGLLPVHPWLKVFSFVIAGLISYTWYRYLTWLDVFEPEKRWAMALTFVLSSALVLAVPLLYYAFESVSRLAINGRFWNDLQYSVLVIGMVEELAKVLPYLIILVFTRQVNEPYDHLLYCSISALGFAFVENLSYLERTGLGAVAGRALYAAVAHMFFSSLIGYGIAVALHRRKGRVWLAGLLMYLLASMAHGFYDVWLLVPGRPQILTTVFFLGTIQLWVIMKNNLINISPNAEPRLKFRSTMFRYRIVNAMLAIFMLAFVAIFLMADGPRAWSLFANQWPVMIIMLLILALSFSNYHFIPGYIARLGVSSSPVRWFIPITSAGEDLTGTRIRVDIPDRGWRNIRLPELRRSLPVMGVLERRVVLDDDTDWYLFRPERQLDLGQGFEPLFLMKLDASADTIPDNAYVRMQLCRFRGEARIRNGRVDARSLGFGPRVYARLIPSIIGGGASSLTALGGHGLS